MRVEQGMVRLSLAARSPLPAPVLGTPMYSPRRTTLGLQGEHSCLQGLEGRMLLHPRDFSLLPW